MAGLPLLTFMRGSVGVGVAHLTQNNVALQKVFFFLTVGTGLNKVFILKILLCPTKVN